ncbi:hypothetical protein PQX77_009128 [Marasmius sp. AFHP31]|nr:hypothetical protein PQX77_009128 [Marasmius sp. AFHP31]
MPPKPGGASVSEPGRGRGRGRGRGTGRGAGRKPVLKRDNSVTPSLSESPLTTSKNPTLGSTTELPTPDPNRLQTRQSNKNVHPGAAHHAYTTIRRSAEEVQAERDQLEREAIAAESTRLQKVAALAAHEDSVQKQSEEYNKNFAHLARSIVIPSASTTQSKLMSQGVAPILRTPTRPILSLKVPMKSAKTPEARNAEKEKLLRQLALLETEEDELNDEQSKCVGIAEEEPGPETINVEVQDDMPEKPQPDLAVTHPEAPTDAVASRKKTPRGTPQTNRSEVNNARATLPLVQSLHKASSNGITSTAIKRKTPSDGGKSTQTNGGQLKKNKAADEVGGLKKNDSKKGRKPQVGDTSIPDSMLQEGVSIGFDDNKALNLVERQQAGSIAQLPLSIVKITPQPFALPTGKAARGGDTKFSSKHLPEFMRQNNGSRKIFTPLSKEAVGYVHAWSTLHRELLQGIVDRGWGIGRVTIPDTSQNAVTAVGNIKASDFRHELGHGALAIVEEFIREHWSDDPPPSCPEDEIEWVFRSDRNVGTWAEWQTRKFSVGNGPQLSPFLFATFVADEEGHVLEKKGMFENELILRVLALYLAHVDSIPPHITRLDGFPFGALELSIQALERALYAYTTGTQVISGTFSYDDWGKKPVLDSKGRQKVKTTEFRKTIENLSKEKQDAILSGSRVYVKAKGRSMDVKRKDIQEPEQLEDGEGSDSDVMMSDPPEPSATVEAEDAAVEPAQSSGCIAQTASPKEQPLPVNVVEEPSDILMEEMSRNEEGEPESAHNDGNGNGSGSENEPESTPRPGPA